MMSLSWGSVVLVFFGFCCVSTASPPSIGRIPKVKLPGDVNPAAASQFIGVTDADSDSFTCTTQHIVQSLPFNVMLTAGTNGYLLTISHSNPSALTSSEYFIKVQCTDVNSESATADVTVSISKNSPPTANTNRIETVTVDVSTLYKPQTVLHTVQATDPDGDHVTCTATSVSAKFTVDPNDCKIRNVRDLRYLILTSSEVIDINVSDGVNQAVAFKRILSFTNMNYPPKFSVHQSTVPVNEHVTALTSLFQFTVTDDDSFDVRWEVNPLNESSYFTFDDATREIKLASGKSFDYETKRREFIITCIASDGYLQSSSSVTISIFDSNDPPYFSSSSVTTTADEGPGGTISFIPPYRVVDPDGDKLTYKIVAGGNYSGHFAINMADGKLTNVVTLDRDEGAPNPIRIQVSVTDPSGLSATSDVIIFLNDVNDNTPVFAQKSYEFKVGLSTTEGSLLGTVTATDKDHGSNAQLNLAIAKQNPAGFMKLEQDGRLYLTRGLNDVNYGTLFSLTINATDHGTPSRSAAAVVDVVWNDGPKIINLPYTVYVSENLEGKQAIFNLSVIDAESDQFTCILQTIVPQPSSTLFSVIDTGNKNFKVFFTGSGKLSSSDVTKYTLSITCQDINAKVTKDLTVTVQTNTAPLLTCSPVANITIDGLTTTADQTVYTIIAKDAEKDALTYSLTSTFFYVGKYSGVIKATKSLRSVTTDQFALAISVTDDKHTAGCTLNIFLNNVNAAPYFSNLDHAVDIPENTAPGSALYVISVVDPNIVGTNIDIQWSGLNPDRFKFDVAVSGLTATVKLATGQKLDYENQADRTLTLTFTASDGHLTSQTKTLTVRVTPVNEPPYFDKNIVKYFATFKEIAQPPEVGALSCHVVDPDEDDKVTLTLSGTHASLFSIADLTNCQLTLTSEYDLDGGAPDKVTLTLTATDKQGEKAEATVTVTIQPVNDNTPQFDGPVLLKVARGMVAGEEVGKVEARDKDVGKDGVMTYEVAVEPLNVRLADQYLTFSSTGQFILRQPMDALTSSENFRYVIRVKDGGNPPKSSTTTVNVVYDPNLTTTPNYNLTTTIAITTAITTESTDTVGSGEDALWEQPLVIGMLVALCLLAALVLAVGLFLCCKYFGLCSSASSCCSSRPVTPTSIYPSRPNTPVRTNKISVISMDNSYNPTTPSAATGCEGRKISAIMPLPPAHY